MGRYYCSSLPPVPTDPPLRVIIEAPDETLATAFARERIGASGLIVKRVNDPDAELRQGKDGAVWIRELDPATGQLGEWRKRP